MGQLVDLDKVLAIPMSKRAKAKVLELEAVPAIVYECEKSMYPHYPEKGRHECHTLACIMLMAFRYGVNRHGTQCLFRPDEHTVIEQNLDLMCDDFIRQMICGIHNEYRLWNLRQEEGQKLYCLDNPHYLQPMLDKLQDEYEKRGYKRIPLDDCW